MICGTVCECGPNYEPLACGFKKGHEGEHSWSSLPTFAPFEQRRLALLAANKLLEMENGAGAPVGVDAEEWHDEMRRLIRALRNGVGV